MPKAYDLQRLRITHDPTQRADFNTGKLPKLDFEKIFSDALGQVPQFIEDTIYGIIADQTGIDLRTLSQQLHTIPADLIAQAFADGSEIAARIAAQIIVLFTSTTASNDWLSAVGEAWENTLSQIATLQAQVAAINNHPSTPASQTGIDLAGWTNVSGAMAFSTFGSYLQTSALAAAIRALAPTTDKHFVAVEIDAKQQGITRATLCGDTTFSNYAGMEVYCGFDGDSVRLITGSSPSLAVIQKQADFLVPKLSNKWVFEIRYDPATNTFSAYRNGTPIPDMAWTDTANIVTHGSTKRKVGLVTNALSGITGQQGPAVSKYTFGDWA